MPICDRRPRTLNYFQHWRHSSSAPHRSGWRSVSSASDSRRKSHHYHTANCILTLNFRAAHGRAYVNLWIEPTLNLSLACTSKASTSTPRPSLTSLVATPGLARSLCLGIDLRQPASLVVPSLFCSQKVRCSRFLDAARRLDRHLDQPLRLAPLCQLADPNPR